MKKRTRRIWALLLSAALAAMQLPPVAMAQSYVPEDGSIASFKDLERTVKNQTVPLGTELSELNLPDRVEADIYQVFQDSLILDEEDMEEKDSLSTPSQPQKKATDSNPTGTWEDGNHTVSTITTSSKNIAAAWNSSPVYDSQKPGTYRFMADVGSYILSKGVELPQILVTVGGDCLKTKTSE